jgi:hypothetical protein
VVRLLVGSESKVRLLEMEDVDVGEARIAVAMVRILLMMVVKCMLLLASIGLVDVWCENKMIFKLKQSR